MDIDAGPGLVIHVRSGDIFGDAVISAYGQVTAIIKPIHYIGFSNMYVCIYKTMADLTGFLTSD